MLFHPKTPYKKLYLKLLLIQLKDYKNWNGGWNYLKSNPISSDSDISFTTQGLNKFEFFNEVSVNCNNTEGRGSTIYLRIHLTYIRILYYLILLNLYNKLKDKYYKKIREENELKKEFSNIPPSFYENLNLKELKIDEFKKLNWFNLSFRKPKRNYKKTYLKIFKNQLKYHLDNFISTTEDSYGIPFSTNYYFTMRTGTCKKSYWFNNKYYKQLVINLHDNVIHYKIKFYNFNLIYRLFLLKYYMKHKKEFKEITEIERDLERNLPQNVVRGIKLSKIKKSL